MAKQIMDLAQLCEALGVDRPNEVTRVVLDIKSGHVPMLLIERIADAQKIVAALTGPGIELRRDDPGATLHARSGRSWRQNRCDAVGGQATNDADATCPACRAIIDDASGAIERPL